VTWSLSRILGNFLVYRELDQPFSPGDKKKATREKDRHPARPGEPYSRPDRTGEPYSPLDSTSEAYSLTRPQLISFTTTSPPSDAEQQLVGPLVDSYGFKSNGLVKKIISVTVQGVTHQNFRGSTPGISLVYRRIA
jgi:hypothetical protein